ncbi:MAG: hypothetical protein M0Q42_11900 [Xanthomonadales bacterium]|nr:hypothetical protein [Xanthomonadales bacterium]
MHALFRFAALAAFGLAALASSGPVAAATYSVGIAGGCSHISLAEALAAAQANPDGPHLIKERNQEILVGGVTITNPAADITLEGGYANCSDSAPVSNGRLVILQMNPGRVMTLIGASAGMPRRTITFKRVTITGGDAGSEDGGGILVGSALELRLSDGAVVTGNTARDGGGVALASLTPYTDSKARLVLEGNALIERNKATRHGGGIHAFWGAEIVLNHGEIGRNQGMAGGGGIFLDGEDTALEISTGGNQMVRLRTNYTADESTPFSSTSGHGGAIYSRRARIVANTVGNPGTLRIWIDNNNANHGGAIYVDGHSDGSFTSVQLRGSRIANNYARGRGGAFYSRNSVDWVVSHDNIGRCEHRIPIMVWYMPCSYVLSNVAGNETTPNTAGGGVFYLQHNPGAPRAIARVRRTLFENNRDHNGLAAIVAAEGANEYFIERSVFKDNAATGNAGSANPAALLHTATADSWLLYSTVMANDVQRLFVFGGSKLTTRGSIFWNPGRLIWNRPHAVMDHGDCLISHTATNIPAGISLADPLLDEDGRPRKGSLAWDHCDGSVTADAEGRLPYDIPGVDDHWGYNDLGAYEQSDIIYTHGMGPYPGN